VFVLVELLVDTKCYHNNMRRDERKGQYINGTIFGFKLIN